MSRSPSPIYFSKEKDSNCFELLDGSYIYKQNLSFDSLRLGVINKYTFNRLSLKLADNTTSIPLLPDPAFTENTALLNDSRTRFEEYILQVLDIFVYNATRNMRCCAQISSEERVLQDYFEKTVVLSHIYCHILNSNYHLCRSNENLINVTAELTGLEQSSERSFTMSTQRDIYYHLKRYFLSQIKVNRVILNLGSWRLLDSKIIDIPRHHLGIIASSRGFVGGSISIDFSHSATNSDHATFLTVENVGAQGLSIPGMIALGSRRLTSSPFYYCTGGDGKSDGYSAVYSPKMSFPCFINADTLQRPSSFFGLQCAAEKFLLSPLILTVLIVEKDAVFQRLMREEIYKYNVILITSCGFPCVAVRSLIRCIVDEYKAQSRENERTVPVFPGSYPIRVDENLRVIGLFDYDPSGILILLQYLRGSKYLRQTYSGNRKRRRSLLKSTCSQSLSLTPISEVDNEYSLNHSTSNSFRSMCDSVCISPFLNDITDDSYSQESNTNMSRLSNCELDSVSFALSEIKWLGIRSDDIKRLRDSSRNCFLPFTERDKVLAHTLAESMGIGSSIRQGIVGVKRLRSKDSCSNLIVPPEWEREIEYLINSENKCEIEGFYENAWAEEINSYAAVPSQREGAYLFEEESFKIDNNVSNPDTNKEMNKHLSKNATFSHYIMRKIMLGEFI